MTAPEFEAAVVATQATLASASDSLARLERAATHLHDLLAQPPSLADRIKRALARFFRGDSK